MTLTKDLLSKRLADGVGYRAVAREFGISHQAVYEKAHRWGFPRKRPFKSRGTQHGRFVDQWGYVMVKVSERPGALAYKPEHVLVMEKHLGRCLSPSEVVHHINGVKADNHPDNLLVCTRKEHMTIHKDLEALAMQARL